MKPTVINHTSSSWAARGAWLTVIVALVGFSGESSRAQQGPPAQRGRALFEARGEPSDAAPGQADRTRKRSRRVRVDVGALQQADAPGGASTVVLNLFDDVQLRARQSHREATRSGGSIWKGRLLDVAGEATFAVQDGVMAGTVFAGEQVFEILYAGDGEHDVREIEPSAFPTDDPPADLLPIEPDPQAAAVDAAVAADMASDSAAQIDVLVVWTPAARTAAGGVSAIQSLINLAVANANSSYANSAVTQRVRLVYSGELAHTEGSPSTDLSRLAMTTDGYLDTVHTLRNTYGADVVTLLGNGYVNAGACGIGYLMTYVSTGFASSAFNVVDRTCAAGNLTYAHEMGHNMGLQHDPANASSTPAYSYAYGYQEPTGLFRTVMAYACPSGSCPRLMYFSNPSVSYNGRPVGSASQNNALALNNTAPSVANFRQAVTGSCTYTLGSASTSVASGAATSSVSVTAGSGCAWTATSNASWLTITGGASGSGNGTTAFSVAANTAGTSRSGTLTVAGQTFTVTQAAAACGAFAISPTSQANVAASGASLSVTVTGTAGCARTATSNASWITVTAGATGTGSGTVSLSVAANTAGTSRTGTVTIAGQTYTVTQLGAACAAFSLSPSGQSVAAGGGSVSVTVTGTTGCARTATSNASWITVTAGATGTGSGTVSLSVAANTVATSRTGTVTIGGQTFTVSQAAAACAAVSLSPTGQSVAAAGGAVSVGVTGTAGCAWTATSNASWITVTSGATGTGSGTVSINVAANTAGASRTGTVTVGGQTFTVTQSAAACGAFSLSPTSQSVVAAGGPVSVSVTGTTACARTATSNASWITVTSGATGTGSGTVALSVAANTVGTSRTGTVTIGGQVFSVTQAAAACAAFALSPASQTVAAAGGTVSVSVTGTTGCARTATSNASWITVTVGATGTGGGTVSLSVAANTAGTTRTGTVTIGGQTFTVSQAAAACTYTLSKTAESVGAGSWSSSAGVTATTGCGWTGISNAAWITVASGASGTGNGSVSYSVAANGTTSPRSGTMTIAGRTLTVTQAGLAPVVVSSLTADTSFPVATKTAITWTAVASGGGGPLEYQFWRFRQSTAEWTMVRDYAAGNTYSWTPTNSEAGTYALQVWVRVAGSSASYDAYRATGTFSITGPRPLSVSLARLDLAQPAAAGAPITWTAVADGGISPQQFKFWLYSAQTGWQVLREYGTSGVLSWTPQRPGQYALQVWVRNPGSQANYDAWTSSGYFDVVAGPQRVALQFSRPLPSAVGVPLTLTAIGSGPADPLEYQFWVLSDGAWSVLRAYDTNPVAVWTPATPGTKAVQVWSRRVGAASMEAWTTSGFVTIGTAPVVLTQFTSNQTFPLPGLTPITWQAQASGGSAALEFQFWRLSNGAWSIVQPYGASATYTWTPQAANTGQHAVQVWVRSTGSSANYEQWATTGMFEITP